MRGGVELFNDWDALAAEAAGALDRRRQPSLFDRLDWFRLVAAHTPPPGHLLAARAGEDAQRGWLILAKDGARAEAFANWYSLRVGGIGADDAMTAIARALRQCELHQVSLAPMAEPHGLATAFARAGWWTDIRPQTISWQAMIGPGGFDAWWAARPGQLRSTVKRKAKTAGLDIRIYRAFDARAWADYEAIYADSWKGEEGSPAFLRALARQEGDAGALRLGLAYKDGRAIAAQLWLVENAHAYIHKLAYREDAKALSPGTLLSFAMFRAAIDKDGVRHIDYGTGDDAYKRDWMDERRILWRLTAYDPRRPLGLLGWARARLSRLASRLRSQ